MTFGFQPMAFRLDVYSGGQPPRMWNRAAMPDNVSPYWTTYVRAGVVAVWDGADFLDGVAAGDGVAPRDGAATVRVRVRMTSVLLAVRVFAWAE
jgi:hypothetical protein